MTEQSNKELLDILGVKVEPKNTTSSNVKEEYIISAFEEIQNFFKEYKRLPLNQKDKNIFERIFAIRLKRIYEHKEFHDFLRPLDYQNLLSRLIEENIELKNENYTDSDLLEELSLDPNLNRLTDLKHVRSSDLRKFSEGFASREKCENFDFFKPLFKKVEDELNHGFREILTLENRPLIKKGMYFILNGLITYVAEVGESFIQDYGIKDSRLLLIFNNGTQSRMLMQSFHKGLSLDEKARIITEPNLGPLFSDQAEKEDIYSGSIYILRSFSKNKYIQENRELIHKIGFTTGEINKRISKAKVDPTFLMAEVEVVGSCKLFNIKSSKFENLIQKIFRNSKLDITINDRFGNRVKPDEWFLVPLNVIEDVIQKIIDESITEYIYEPSQAKLIKRKNESEDFN